jgi:polyferredoxin
MSGAVTRFLGDSPVRVLLKLIVASLIVGMVMATFGWSPYDVFYAVRDFFVRLWNMGFAAIDQFLGYILLGAAIVIPAFIILRLLSLRRN